MLRTAISKQAKNSFNRLSPYEARLLLIMFEIFKLNKKLIIVSFVVAFKPSLFPHVAFEMQ